MAVSWGRGGRCGHGQGQGKPLASPRKKGKWSICHQPTRGPGKERAERGPVPSGPGWQAPASGHLHSPCGMTPLRTKTPRSHTFLSAVREVTTPTTPRSNTHPQQPGSHHGPLWHSKVNTAEKPEVALALRPDFVKIVQLVQTEPFPVRCTKQLMHWYKPGTS